MIVGVVLGIQFITGSVEAKSKVKESLIPYFTGCVVIFGAFGILNLLGIFPQKLVTNLQTAMGMTQGITATVGMIIAFVIYKLECRK